MKLKNLFRKFFYIITLFLLIIIPLYPKKPLIDVQNTWVYIRMEDFVVLFVLLLYFIAVLKKKISIKTPFTLPLLLFWIIGVVSTIHAFLVIFPHIANVHPNVSFLSFIRRIEYMSLFFVAYEGFRSYPKIKPIIFVLTVVYLVVVGYGIGQRYFGFPAYLTMNEEFAKGIPIRLSIRSRIASTFAGHYDLSAYMVLMISLFGGLFFESKRIFLRIWYGVLIVLGFGIITMAVSRISMISALVSLFLLLFWHNKKYVFYAIPFGILTLLLFFFLNTSLLNRLTSTVQEIEVLVDAKTGKDLGHVRMVPREYFKDMTIITPDGESTTSSIIAKKNMPSKVYLITEGLPSTGETLPQGTGYINLRISPNIKRIDSYYFYDVSKDNKKAYRYDGKYIIKRAFAYDMSFTTRFQGEWPLAVKAFNRNIFLGSGYGSVNLAVDNNYLRILAETGILGFISYFSLFIVMGYMILYTFSSITSTLMRGFLKGVSAGFAGLLVNAFLIDVFEASKIAFLLWILFGICAGMMITYLRGYSYFGILKKVLVSFPFYLLYLVVLGYILYYPMFSFYFTGDDFTWFRWVSDCTKYSCNNILSYFTNANGFFYRPGTKLFFHLMYKLFWLNPFIYHFISFLLHVTFSVLLFIFSNRLFKNIFKAFLAGAIFLLLSGYSEAVYWISAIGFLFNGVFSLLSLILYSLWREKNKYWLKVLAYFGILISLLFHELGVIVPLLLLLYDRIFYPERKTHNKIWYYSYLFSPIVIYGIVRWGAGSHWFSGDYNYHIAFLPFNILGNLLGYIGLSLTGTSFYSLYRYLRFSISKNLLFATSATFFILTLCIVGYRRIRNSKSILFDRVFLFGSLSFVISLFPFLGFGNITSRYSYLSSAGIAIVLVWIGTKIYTMIRREDKTIASFSVLLMILVGGLYHIMIHKDIQNDWYSAGRQVQLFFQGMDSAYESNWKTDQLHFYFVNTPIKKGEAWVFPVGVEDGLALIFNNNALSYTNVDSLQKALRLYKDRQRDKIFIFNKDGKIREYVPGDSELSL